MKSSFTLLTLYILAFIAHTSFSFLFPVIPLYAAEVGAPVSQVGLIVATFNYLTALFIIPLGMLSDRIGHHKLLVVGFIILTGVPLLYQITGTPQQLIVVRAIHGFGLASFIPAAFALAIELAPVERRGEAMGWYAMSVQLGILTGPITGGFLLNRFDFGAAFYGCSAISILGLFFILCRINAFSQRPAATLDRGSSWSWLKKRAIIAGLLAYMFIPFGAGTICAYIPLYVKAFGINAAGAGLIISALFASSALLMAPSGKLSDKLGRKPMIICGLIVSAIAVALISQFQGLFQLILTSLLFGIGFGIVAPASLALVAELSSASGRGLSMGITNCLFQVGLATGPTIMGFVVKMTDFETMFVACGMLLAIALLVVMGLLRTRR